MANNSIERPREARFPRLEVTNGEKTSNGRKGFRRLQLNSFPAEFYLTLTEYASATNEKRSHTVETRISLSKKEAKAVRDFLNEFLGES